MVVVLLVHISDAFAGTATPDGERRLAMGLGCEGRELESERLLLGLVHREACRVATQVRRRHAQVAGRSADLDGHEWPSGLSVLLSLKHEFCDVVGRADRLRDLEEEPVAVDREPARLACIADLKVPVLRRQVERLR